MRGLIEMFREHEMGLILFVLMILTLGGGAAALIHEGLILPRQEELRIERERLEHLRRGCPVDVPAVR